jgi:hypothetical protein
VVLTILENSDAGSAIVDVSPSRSSGGGDSCRASRLFSSVTVISRIFAIEMLLFLRAGCACPNLSRCPYCGSRPPGFETLCQNCYEERCARISRPKPWRPTIPRMSGYNAGIFLFFFAFCFFARRFDFPYFRYPMTTPTAALVAFMLAPIVVCCEGKR